MAEIDDIRAQIADCCGALSDPTTRMLTVRLLALMADGGGSSDSGVVLSRAYIAFGDIPVAFAAAGFVDTTKRVSRLYISNTTDVDIEISTDDGTSVAFTVPANTNNFFRDLGNYTAPTDIMLRYVTQPTTGSISFDGSY